MVETRSFPVTEQNTGRTMSRIGWSREMRLLSWHFRDSMKDNFSTGLGRRGWSWGRLKGGLISNTNRNKSPREFASILPFSSSNWQNRKIIPRVWSCLVEVGRERRTWFFNGGKEEGNISKSCYILIQRVSFDGLLAAIYDNILTKEIQHFGLFESRLFFFCHFAILEIYTERYISMFIS